MALARLAIRLLVLLMAGAVLPLAASQPIAAQVPETPAFAISEVKLGALYHDVPGLWSGFSLERPGPDANFEVLFAPWARTFGGYLRPALGATVNFVGDTSKAYADLRWEIEAPSGVFFALGMGRETCMNAASASKTRGQRQRAAAFSTSVVRSSSSLVGTPFRRG